MRTVDTGLSIIPDRGSRGLPLERIYRHLFDPELMLRAYGKIYRNAGAMTRGVTPETVDWMSEENVHMIIYSLKQERWTWAPVRRIHIPKANGKTRPLGIPTWRDKLVQEALRTLLEAYYERRFSDMSHGFRPKRGCHTALVQIRKTWNGTIWFIEGDIKGCFDNIDHHVLLEILRRDLHDDRLIRLIDGLLKAGYMENWKYNETLSGTPQGGILSPLLANIYLHELDKFIEETLIPEYTRGDKRKINPEYFRVNAKYAWHKKNGRLEEARRLLAIRRNLPTVDHFDDDYRRLRYVRYADDFLLGYIGPKNEAEQVKTRIGEFLRDNLKLTLSPEKTSITHASDDTAKFLGYEIGINPRSNQMRRMNSAIYLRMPRKAVQRIRSSYSSKGIVTHLPFLLNEDEYTIIQRYQAVLSGMYNYYCLATNVSRQMNEIRWILETSLTKTLARKLRCKVTDVYRRFHVRLAGLPYALIVRVEREGKNPLIAQFGGIKFQKKQVFDKEALGEPLDLAPIKHGLRYTQNRCEQVQRLLADECELCGGDGPLQAHHINKLANLKRKRRPLTPWEMAMIARSRKSLMVCLNCHREITHGKYDGPHTRGRPESRVR